MSEVNKKISFKTSGLSGDIIYSLAGIQHVCGQLNAKANYYVWLDRPFFLYEGATHPYKGMVNQYAFSMLKPLLMHQPYIHDMQPWNGEQVTVDLDMIRQRQINMPYGNLARWWFYVFPDMACDLSKPWLHVDKSSDLKDKILINRTERYNNGWINYFFLKDYQEKMVFVGLHSEWEKFCKEWNLDRLPLLSVRNFLDLAVAINSCRFFIGNQSMCFGLAEALKVPRVLELFGAAQNIMPCGEHAYDFFVQNALEYYVEYLDKNL